MRIYHVEICDSGEVVREVRVEADNAVQAKRIAAHMLWAGEYVGYVTHAYGE